MILELELYLSLEKNCWVSAVPVSGKDCPGMIPGLELYLSLEKIAGLALYLFLERIVLE